MFFLMAANGSATPPLKHSISQTWTVSLLLGGVSKIPIFSKAITTIQKIVHSTMPPNGTAAPPLTGTHFAKHGRCCLCWVMCTKLRFVKSIPTRKNNTQRYGSTAVKIQHFANMDSAAFVGRRLKNFLFSNNIYRYPKYQLHHDAAPTARQHRR